jgi:hypothetical protein
MGTRSVTKIHDGGKDAPVLVAIYQQFDGYFDGVGENLQDFLKEMVIVNGIGLNTPKKAANGMGCLAAQVIHFLKKDIGGTYITSTDDEQEYNYDIYLKDNKLVLEGEGGSETKTFDLNV